MDAQPEPTVPDGGAGARASSADVRMQVRRSPRYGVFMALGALLGAVLAWWFSATVPPALNPAGEPVDTTPVIGLMLVVGFFAGGALGSLVAVMIDRAMAKRLTPVVAERIEVQGADASGRVADGAAAAGGAPDGAEAAGAAADSDARLAHPADDPPNGDDLRPGA